MHHRKLDKKYIESPISKEYVESSKDARRKKKDASANVFKQLCKVAHKVTSMSDDQRGQMMVPGTGQRSVRKNSNRNERAQRAQVKISTQPRKKDNKKPNNSPQQALKEFNRIRQTAKKLIKTNKRKVAKINSDQPKKTQLELFLNIQEICEKDLILDKSTIDKISDWIGSVEEIVKESQDQKVYLSIVQKSVVKRL